MDQFNALQILEKMEFFYNNAWNRLMLVVGIFAIAVPIVWYFLQQRFFRIEEEKIKKELKKIISDDIKSEFEKREEDLSNVIENKIGEMERRISEAEGGLFHVQGVALSGLGDAIGAFRSFLQAIPNYLASKNERDLQIVLTSLNSLWTNIYNEDILQLDMCGVCVENYIKMLEANNETGKYYHYIITMKKGFEEAKKRILQEEKAAK